jgi:isoquinoline 1-oxidoreductase beta subunit
MEPVNATAWVTRDRCEVWAPTQTPGWNVETVSKLTRLPASAITIHRLLAGGGFGRKSSQDFIVDAVEASMACKAPVKIVYTRDDDLQHDFYRPPFHHRIHAGLDDRGKIVAWDHRLAGPSVLATWKPDDPPIEIDYISVAGAETNLYAIPNFRADTARVEIAIPRGIWRSIGNSHTCFVAETMIDELAAVAGIDPIEFRLAHLQAPRARAVLARAAEIAASTPLPPGQSRGVAMFAQLTDDGSHTCVAEIAEISVAPSLRVHRVICVIDCGLAVNPPAIAAQMEGGIVFGMTAALYGEITIARGAVEQRNFDGYPLLRIHEMPVIDVEVITSDEPPSGAGELAVPAIAPAIANARFAATGIRTRRLPISSSTAR